MAHRVNAFVYVIVLLLLLLLHEDVKTCGRGEVGARTGGRGEEGR